ncbi:hypothetical protein RRG08_025975 [Elysia crispata]|uniref:Uncharacterized protein n=1 Tax=Elysia crispata TaxID=231223 RepID=A0AAE0ZI02_9GAST|nr:hypothetical protein RRG08_025975 [Elysia crispata]
MHLALTLIQVDEGGDKSDRYKSRSQRGDVLEWVRRCGGLDSHGFGDNGVDDNDDGGSGGDDDDDDDDDDEDEGDGIIGSKMRRQTLLKFLEDSKEENLLRHIKRSINELCQHSLSACACETILFRRNKISGRGLVVDGSPRSRARELSANN